MSFDKFLLRRYKRDTYNCLHFTRDVWLELRGEDIGDKLAGLLGAAHTRQLRRHTMRAFTRLVRRLDPCLVLMRAGGKQPHVGVFVNGRLLHLQKTGPEYLPFDLAVRGFNEFRYYQ